MLDICEISSFFFGKSLKQHQTKKNKIFAIFKTKIARQFAQKTLF